MARPRRRLQAKLRRLLLEPHGLRLHLRVRAARVVGGLLAAGVLQLQPRQSRPAQPLPAVHPAGVRPGDHDERLGRRAAAGHGRTVADHPRQRPGGGRGQVSGRGRHLHRGVDVFLRLQPDHPAALGHARLGPVPDQLSRLLVHRPGDAGGGDGGQFPDEQPDRGLRARGAVQRAARARRPGRHGDEPGRRLLGQVVEPGRAFRRLRPGRRQPVVDRLLPGDRDRVPVSGDGPDRPAALGGAPRRRGAGAPLPGPHAGAPGRGRRRDARVPGGRCAGRPLRGADLVARARHAAALAVARGRPPRRHQGLRQPDGARRLRPDQAQPAQHAAPV